MKGKRKEVKNLKTSAKRNLRQIVGTKKETHWNASPFRDAIA